jgi:hypothetical protein
MVNLENKMITAEGGHIYGRCGMGPMPKMWKTA